MSDTAPDANGVHRTRLFAGICLALIPTGASFALVANVMGQLKAEFILTNAAVGFIAGSFVWGMAISLLVLGPMLESYGMKKGTVAAFIGHLTGVILLLLAYFFASEPLGFWLLTLGAVAMAIGHGMIEVAGNPLTAALYPKDKTSKLNWFHAFFPIGILAGSLIGYGVSFAEGTFLYHWTFQIGIIVIPVIIYGILVLPQKFPPTENTAAGLPVSEMFRFTFTSPLMYVLLIMMAVAISIELGAMRWIPEVFGRVGIQEAILLMSWISLIMVVLRLNAAWFVEKATPPGLLMIGGLSMAIGMFIFGIATGGLTAFLGATFFGIGVAFFFPTTVGIVAERLPKTGSLGIVLTCGVGLLAAGAVGTPAIGFIGDVQLSSYIDEEDRRARTIEVVRVVNERFPEFQAAAEGAEDPLAQHGFVPVDLDGAVGATAAALERYQEDGQRIRGNEVAQAMRATIDAVPGGQGQAIEEDPEFANEEAFNAEVARLLEEGTPEEIAAFADRSAAHSAVLAGAMLNPAEGYGGQRALLLISWLPLILFFFYGGIFILDRARGGYKAVRIEDAMGDGEEVEVPHEGAVPAEATELVSQPAGGSEEGESEQQDRGDTPKA